MVMSFNLSCKCLTLELSTYFWEQSSAITGVEGHCQMHWGRNYWILTVLYCIKLYNISVYTHTDYTCEDYTHITCWDLYILYHRLLFIVQCLLHSVKPHDHSETYFGNVSIFYIPSENSNEPQARQLDTTCFKWSKLDHRSEALHPWNVLMT